MINLDGKRFSPLKNSEGGRVASDAIFVFQQHGSDFSAIYSGSGFSGGHLIGCLAEDNTADLVYHSRAEDGTLQAGQAKAIFALGEDNKWTISMDWQWLNGDQNTGTSFYGEI